MDGDLAIRSSDQQPSVGGVDGYCTVVTGRECVDERAAPVTGPEFDPFTPVSSGNKCAFSIKSKGVDGAGELCFFAEGTPG